MGYSYSHIRERNIDMFLYSSFIMKTSLYTYEVYNMMF